MDHKEAAPTMAMASTSGSFPSLGSGSFPPRSQGSPSHFHLPVTSVGTSSPRVHAHGSSSLTHSPHLPTRPRLPSVTNSPALTPMPSNLLHIPAPRDTRNPAYTHLACSVHAQVAAVVKNLQLHSSATLSNNSGEKEKPEAALVSSVPSPSASGTSSSLQSSNLLHSLAPLNTASPSHHHTSSSINSMPAGIRLAQYHRLLVNLLTYLPPLPADYFQVNKQEFEAEAHSHMAAAFSLAPTVSPVAVSLSSSSPPNHSPSASQPSTPRSISRTPFVALNVSAATGRVYYEEKLPWPISDVGNSSLAAPVSLMARANSSPGTISGPNTNPSSPSHSHSSGASASTAFAALTRDDLPVVRRKSVSEDGEVVVAIVILLDVLEIDSKQVTFIAAHRHLAIDSLFKILYKIDLTQPKPPSSSHTLSALLAPSPAIHSRVLKNSTEAS